MIKDQLIIYLKCIGPCVKLLSNLINHFPYLISDRIFEQFQRHQTRYQNLAALCRESGEDYGDVLLEPNIILETRRILQACHALVKNEALILIFQNMAELINQLQTSHDDSMRVMDPAEFAAIQSSIVEASQQLNTYFNHLVKETSTKKEALKSERRRMRAYVHDTLGLERYRQARRAYRQVVVYKACLEDPAQIIRGLPLESVYLLTYERAIDLWFLIDILRHEAVVTAIQNHQALLENHYESCQHKLRFLRRHIENDSTFAEVVRIYRAIHWYKKWTTHVTTMQERLLERLDHPDLSLVIRLRRLTTYEKAAYFRTHFKAQHADTVIDGLYQFISQRDKIRDTATELLTKLKSEKTAALAVMHHTEDLFRDRQALYQEIIAEAVLAVTQQPSYQLGSHVLGMLNAAGDASGLPILSARLPDYLNEERLRTITGLGFLGVTLYMSRLIGYSYHFIASVNHILFSHIDFLIQIGEVCDRLSQKAGLPVLDWIKTLTPEKVHGVIESIKEVMRLDELGIAEKEQIMRWFSGLGMNVMMTSGNLPSAALGYTTATAGASVTGFFVKETAMELGASRRVAVSASIVARAFVYPQAYKVGYRAGLHFFTMPNEARALTVLGLEKTATERDIQKQYRRLSLQFHPDKCGDDCKRDITEINTAYEILMKKMQ